MEGVEAESQTTADSPFGCRLRQARPSGKLWPDYVRPPVGVLSRVELDSDPWSTEWPHASLGERISRQSAGNVRQPAPAGRFAGVVVPHARAPSAMRPADWLGWATRAELPAWLPVGATACRLGPCVRSFTRMAAAMAADGALVG